MACDLTKNVYLVNKFIQNIIIYSTTFKNAIKIQVLSYCNWNSTGIILLWVLKRNGLEYIFIENYENKLHFNFNIPNNIVVKFLEIIQNNIIGDYILYNSVYFWYRYKLFSKCRYYVNFRGEKFYQTPFLIKLKVL